MRRRMAKNSLPIIIMPLSLLPQYLLRSFCWIFLWQSYTTTTTINNNSNTLLVVVQAGPLHLQCDPCLDRTKLEIHAILHGSKDDVGWIQSERAMSQAAEDMNIDFYFNLREINHTTAAVAADLLVTAASSTAEDALLQAAASSDAPIITSSLEMAADIRALIRYELDDSDHGHSHTAVKQVDGLIVNIPDDIVWAAVQDAARAGIHVFGLDAGYAAAQRQELPYLLGYVAQDEYMAGVFAAQTFDERRLDSYGPARSALFINHDPLDPAVQERFRGFNDTLHAIYDDIQVENLVVDTFAFYELILLVDLTMQDCPFDFVLLSGAELSSAVAASFNYHMCDNNSVSGQEYEKDVFGSNNNKGTMNATSGIIMDDAPPRKTMMVGSFDESKEILDQIMLGRIEFTLSPQKYLMSALPIVFSTIYASTGQALRLPYDGGVYNTGPEIIDINNLPSDTDLACQEESFPICAKDGSTTQTICPCTDRQQIRIAGVVHGVVGDAFWDDVIAGAQQAALDMDIRLDFEQFKPQESDEVLHMKMAAKMESLCMSGVDGIFVSIPSELVVNAIRMCRQLRIPIISINSGVTFAYQMGIQYIGQQEYYAGWDSAERMLQTGTLIEAYCLLTEPDNAALIDRCRGFSDFLGTQNVTFGGSVSVPMDNELHYYNNVAAAVGGDPFGSWDGIGLLVVSGPLQSALHIKEHHEGVILGKFDVSKDLAGPLDDGRVLFAVDQQQYLQGSMAVYFLSYGAFTKQNLLNSFIETGPTFVEHAPLAAEQRCVETQYAVCTRVPEENYNFIEQAWLSGGYAMIAIISCAGIVSLIWMHLYRSKNVVTASQPLFLGLLVVGAIISAFAILPMSAQTKYRYLQDPMTGELTDEPNPDIPLVDAACAIAPWLYGIGFSIIFSALCAKIHRVKRIFSAGSAMRRKKVEVKDVMIIMAIIMTGEIIILSVWTALDPPKWEREIVQEGDGYVLESTGTCHSDETNTFLMVQVLYHVACLFYVLFLCWQTSDIPTEFAEGSYISLSILCLFQLSVLAIPIAYMVQDTAYVYYFVRAMFLFLQNFTVLALIFGPKMLRVYTGNDELPLAHVRRNTQPESADYSHGTIAAAPHYGGIANTTLQSNNHSSARTSSGSLPPRGSLASNSERKGSGWKKAPHQIDRMAPIDAESDEEVDTRAAKPAVPPNTNNAYAQLKAGLDADMSSSSSTTSSGGADPEMALPVDGVLAGLAAEISRAKESRANARSMSTEERGTSETDTPNAPPVVAPIARQFKRQDSPDIDSSVESSSNDDTAMDAVNCALHISEKSEIVPVKRQFKRQDSPDIDSSVESSSNDDMAMGALHDALDVAAEPSEVQDLPESDSSFASTSADNGRSENPQEGYETSESSNDKMNIVMDDNHQQESESINTGAASTQGISKAEAFKAEIFHLPRSPSEHHDTPIRFKKAPKDYGENATLALGMTKTPGSFLRKVAASFGSASAASSINNAPATMSVGSKSDLHSPPRIAKKKAVPLARINLEEKSHRPIAAANLKRNVIAEEDENAEVVTEKLNEAATTSTGNLSAPVGETDLDEEAFYFL